MCSRTRARKLKILGLFLLCCVIMVVSFQVVYNPKGNYYAKKEENQASLVKHARKHPVTKDDRTQKKTKIILVWNDLWGAKNWGFERDSIKPFVDKHCAITNCVVTDDKTRLHESDAVMFHMADSQTPRPPYKLSNQRWVFVMHEPPCMSVSMKSWNGWFNWTMSHRYDNTRGSISMQYGTKCKRHKPIMIDFKSIVKRKTKLAAWMVNHCSTDSRREDYVRQLLKYIPVDIYGTCGKNFHQSHICPRSNETICRQMLDKDYKFYLAFENSFAPGYITEKYFKALGINVVPVVRGDGDYAETGLPHSYINTKDFDSPKKLAEYLKHLDKSDNEYVEYLKWKEVYKAGEGVLALDAGCELTPELPFCLLCRKLNDPTEPHHVYDDIEKWWGTCRHPTDV